MNFVFNTSMPRSGSELLQVILHQNPQIYAGPTSPLLEYQYAARGNYNLPEVKSQDPELMQKAFIGMCKGMAESYYSEITDRPVVCDKNRGWSHYYEWVEQWNPNPKMICMIRDPRSVIASLERIYRQNRHMPIGPDNPSKIQNMTVLDRADYWLKTQPVGLALQRTADSILRDINVLYIKYEDLCNSPQQVMNSVYEYIDLDPFDHDFNNLKKEVIEDDSHFGVYGSHTVKSAIVSPKRSDWEDHLPQEVSTYVRDQTKWFFDKFSY